MGCCCQPNQMNHERKYKQWNTYSVSCYENCSKFQYVIHFSFIVLTNFDKSKCIKNILM